MLTKQPKPGRALARIHRRLHRERERTRELYERTLGAVGARHTEGRLIADAAEYWADRDDPRWSDQSHWRGGSVIDRERFDAIGAEHLALFDRLAATVGGAPDLGCVLEWGVGGGANAVHLAPRAQRFIALDINPDSPAEASRRIAETCATPVTEVVVDVGAPETVRDHVPAGSVDLVVCLYVLELVPSPEYGLRVMRLAAELLRPGGLAFVQIKYSTGSASTTSPRRNYRYFHANMTTYRLEEFWTAMEGVGLRPLVMTLVPENTLDRNYGYLLLQRA
ncbi:class I SAM-dependent methyltransferase [Actinomycetospora cinnamomea]|uniref:Methyltransferase family protein n=1 Tax=Actinomycetospora cinnamomea TaxID=663609 RepID=A0A2U1EVJ8_9PSEU|nr:class I SAM-dependent methyltransferase [Actinomycetospora cinnamomea]PVZ03948.1 methyltransferase family protein [Actinomycetospora cinnamomea]